jgi:hypothetical protein
MEFPKALLPAVTNVLGAKIQRLKSLDSKYGLMEHALTDRQAINGCPSIPYLSLCPHFELMAVILWSGWRLGAPPPALISVYRSIFLNCLQLFIPLETRHILLFYFLC